MTWRKQPVVIQDLPVNQEGMRSIAERLICPICGRGPYRSLAAHTVKSHEIGSRDLCDLLGVTFHTHYVDDELRQIISQNAKDSGLGKGDRIPGPKRTFVQSKAGVESRHRRPHNKIDDPPHGTRTRYARLKCRCAECREWKRRSEPYKPASRTHQCIACGAPTFRHGYCGADECQYQRITATNRRQSAARTAARTAARRARDTRAGA